MPKFNDPGNPGKSRQVARKTQQGGIPVIVEPKCLVCNSPHRHLVDKMLVAGMTYSEIERQFEFAGLKRRSISNHKDKHLGYEEAGIRAIIEQEALAAQRNYEDGVSRVVTKNAYLEVALQKAYDALLTNATVVEPKDAVKIIEQLQKLQEQGHGVALDELQLQLQMFIQAVKEVVAKEHWEIIVGRTAELLRASGREVPWDEATVDDYSEQTPAEAIAEITEASVVIGPDGKI